MFASTQALSKPEKESLLATLKTRFEQNMHRHPDLTWSEVVAKLLEKNNKLWSLNEMEKSGGEPDVVGFDTTTCEFLFFDCSVQSPAGRRSFCYDRSALESRKEHQPQDSALDKAATMGIELLTEEQYRQLQQLGNFDTKTSSWLQTPEAIRKHGGAIFADRRYDHVFVYHNGASSYYAARGFRGALKI